MGNKKDNPNLVSENIVKEFALAYKIPLIFTSAFTGENID